VVVFPLPASDAEARLNAQGATPKMAGPPGWVTRFATCVCKVSGGLSAS